MIMTRFAVIVKESPDSDVSGGLGMPRSISDTFPGDENNKPGKILGKL